MSHNNTQARPFLKWAGGKGSIVHAILACFPKKFGRYHEPFLGGGAVFFALGAGRSNVSDVNADLITTYIAVRDHTQALINALQTLKVNQTNYYRVRAWQTETLSNIERAARMIFLNRTCFNGLYRVNKKNQFNVPYGHYSRPNICNADNLWAVASVLKCANIRHEDVFSMARRVRRDDLVYFDPPYDPVSTTASFTAYNAAAFGQAEQIRLAKLFLHLANRGVHVVLSNADTPFVRKLYKGCTFKQLAVRRNINCNPHKRGHVAELLITA